MGNMSYCRFHNTSQDLQDCIDALENYDNDEEENGLENMSKDERRKAEEMREQCETYIRIYDREIADFNDEEKGF